MKSVRILGMAGMASVAIGVSAFGQSVDRYFCTSGDWDDGLGGLNWNTDSDCSSGSTGVPDSDDDVIIVSGKTVDVNVDGVCRSINVQSSAVMIIENGRSVTVNATSFETTSYVNGTVYLSDDGASFEVEDEDHTLDGSGEIVGQHENAWVGVHVGNDYVNELDMRGKMQVRVLGTGAQYTFTNEATFHAESDGVFQISLTLDDTSSAHYLVTTNEAAVLAPGGQIDLNGDFTVLEGELRCLADLNTFGRLVQKGGLVYVQRPAMVIFSDTP